MTKAIVITIDQLGARFLSLYGNTWNPTPSFDRLAARGLTMEFCLSSSTKLETGLGSLFSGKHPLATSHPTSLLAMLEQQGRTSLLIQEGDSLSAISDCQNFTEIQSLPFGSTDQVAESLEQTSIAQFIGLTLETLEQQPDHDLIWIHHAGLGITWDAPMEYREQFFAEEDPDVLEITSPPFGPLVDATDPDEVMQIVHAYAAQVSVLDICLGLLLDQLEALTAQTGEETLLILTSPRALPLGHHGGVGYAASRPATDQLHVPCLVSRLDLQPSAIAPVRMIELRQTEAVFATLVEWLTENHSPNPIAQRSLLSNLLAPDQITPEPQDQITISIFEDESLGIHTPAWFAIAYPDTSYELYVKPDDRWESNPIANRRKDILEEFKELFPRAAEIASEPVKTGETLQNQLNR